MEFIAQFRFTDCRGGGRTSTHEHVGACLRVERLDSVCAALAYTGVRRIGIRVGEIPPARGATRAP